jgi:hypothetical protein
MAEQTVVETVAPVTATTTTEAVAPVVTPEPDLLTKVSQFKLPETQDKIENPPDQPEFAGITDPVAKKAAMEATERMRRGMQSDYTKKIQEAQNLVNQSKSWTPQRIQQELLNNPEFLQAAQMIQGQQAPQERTLTQEEYSALTENEKQQLAAVPQLKNELQQMKNNSYQQQLLSSIAQKDATLKAKFTDYDPQAINEAAHRFGKLTPADAREYIYKADKYEESVKRAYEMGKLEGQGKLQSKLNVITPTGTSAVSNEGVPTKNKGESTQSYFSRLGAFRLAQSKVQK